MRKSKNVLTTTLVALFAAAALLGAGGLTKAQTEDSGARFDSSSFNEIESKYIFGFTEGSGIGLQGEKEFSIDISGRFGKRDGRYTATDTKLLFEFTPTQFTQIEFGGLLASHNIKNVTDLDNRDSFAFNGLFFEWRYLLLDRGQNQPFSATLSIEPEWRRTDETGGERVKVFELETKLAVDVELIQNRMYAGFNLVYEPESVRSREGLEKESNLIVSGALAVRPTPPLLVGAEVGYFRHYEGYALDHYEGYGLFVGPTFYLQLTKKDFISGAWAAQVRGHAIDDPRHLNLEEFSRQRARLKFAHEF